MINEEYLSIKYLLKIDIINKSKNIFILNRMNIVEINFIILYINLNILDIYRNNYPVN